MFLKEFSQVHNLQILIFYISKKFWSKLYFYTLKRISVRMPEVPDNTIWNFPAICRWWIPDSIWINQETVVEPPTAAKGARAWRLRVHIVVVIIRAKAHALHTVVHVWGMERISSVTMVTTCQNSELVGLIRNPDEIKRRFSGFIVPVLEVKPHFVVAELR